MARTVRRVVDLLAGSPERHPERWRLLLDHGSAAAGVRALRAAGPRQTLTSLRGCLDDPRPGVRTAAAAILGVRGAAEAAPWLLEAARTERMDEPRLASAAAAVRCGAPVAQAWALVEAASRRTFITHDGPKATGAALGLGPSDQALRWIQLLDPQADPARPDLVVPRATSELRARAWADLQAGRRERQALEDLAAQRHPDDYEPIRARIAASGRRERHAIVQAWGLLGDPRAMGELVDTLRAIDVDPGHGFRGRRLAAQALGRWGLPGVGPLLERALEDEALDHEGRPGAGLGVQVSVRTTLLVALGEAGAVDQAATLTPYLSNTHGNAQGGFYLAAMDSLWKLGRPEVLLPLLDGAELAAANALGVLAALGHWGPVEERRHHPHPTLRRAVHLALERRAGGG